MVQIYVGLPNRLLHRENPGQEVGFLKQHKNIKRGAAAAVISICIVAAAAAAGIAALKNWRPLREQGSTPKASSKSSVASSYRVAKYTNFLLCGIDNTNSLTDVIIIAGFDEKNKKLSLLQIPRDTYAGEDIPSHKYNAIYGSHGRKVSGMETLKSRFESDFGISVDHYAAVTTKGLRNIVDAVGGVDLDVPINMNYTDKGQNLHIHLNKGYQHLNGSQAEQFVRFRKGWTQGDLGRLNAQRIFLAAFAQKLKSMSVWDIGTKAAPVISPPDFLTDMSGYEMLELYNSAKSISLSNAKVYMAPGEPFRIGGKDYYSIHKADLLNILNMNFVPQGVHLSLSDLNIKQKADTGESKDTARDFENILSGKNK